MSLSKEDWEGIKIFTVTGSIFLLLGCAFIYKTLHAGKYDAASLCPTGREYPVTQILIDKTDPWDVARSTRLDKLIRQIKDNLAIHERMTIYVLDETGNDVPTPVFDMCNPGRGDQVSPLYSNPRRVQKKFDEQFNGPLERMLAELLKPGKAPYSPILETIMNFPHHGGKTKLILISDLMENTRDMSFYRTDPARLPADAEVCKCETGRQYSLAKIYFIDRGTIAPDKKRNVFTFWYKCLEQITNDFQFNRI